jgi:hypothetical protein
MPVATLVSVTLAAGMTAFDVSRTVPTTVAVSNWADALDAPSSSAHTTKQATRMDVPRRF